MGYLKEQYGMQMLGKTHPGTCQECAVAHEPEMPHNKDSLTYQYKFYDKHGRWPTWKDAMDHCSQEMKELWIQALTERGVKMEVEQNG